MCSTHGLSFFMTPDRGILPRRACSIGKERGFFLGAAACGGGHIHVPGVTSGGDFVAAALFDRDGLGQLHLAQLHREHRDRSPVDALDRKRHFVARQLCPQYI